MKATHNRDVATRRNYIDKISMPILEWICVAAMPLYLCNKIIVRLLRTEAIQFNTIHHDNNNLLQSTLVILAVTSLLSLISIVAFTNKNARTQKNVRGDGLVIGSHLVPLMYFALYLLHCQHLDTNQSTSNLGLQHVIYSSCGGLSFMISYNWQHRRKDNADMASEMKRGMMMQLCWKVYLALLLSNQMLLQYYEQSHLHCTFLGLIHILMIACYSGAAGFNTRRDDQKQWQDAFTCGEWMVVSNLTASLIGDFILQHYSFSIDYNPHADYFQEHARIAQAGLAGCIGGVVYCQATSRVLHQGIIGFLAGVVGIVIGFLEMILRSTSFSILQKEWVPHIPRSIQWIIQFLSNEMRVEIGGSAMNFQRYVILGYWSLVIIASIPLTMKLCKWVESNGASKKRRVVAARKFFHLVAVILFTPITGIDSDLMVLSYAIAITLLMILEIIRCYSFVRDNSNDMSSSLNAFFTFFLDEKDSLAADGGLAITHITLIAGCAIPLWMSQILNVTDDSSWLMHLLPYVGVLVLGIGDSVGAIAGIKFGRHSWPGGSSRTLEGSFCMFVSMFVLLGLVGVDNLSSVGTLLAVVTLLEASTSQIDNLCLPLAGTSLVALLAALDASS